MNYADRMEKTVCSQKSDINGAGSETDDCYERIRRKINTSFGYDIGVLEADEL